MIFNPEQVEYIMIGLIISISILIIIVILQAIKMAKIQKNHNKLMRGMKDENIEEIVIKYIERVDQFGERLHDSEKEMGRVKKLLNEKAANVSMVRYNAYEDSGNDLSFSIAVLNDHNNGFVITSLYNRHDQRVYAKPINQGTSSYTLSEEEKEVVTTIINTKK